jgi:hypothetical protein
MRQFHIETLRVIAIYELEWRIRRRKAGLRGLACGVAAVLSRNTIAIQTLRDVK